MTIQHSDAVRNAMGNSIEATIGVDAVLKIFEGSKPANCAAADAGTVLATMDLPTDWMGAFSGGVGVKAGTWQDTAADAAGTAQYYRLYASDGTTCHEQGTVSGSGGGGDIELQNTSIEIGQPVTITAWQKTMPGA